MHHTVWHGNLLHRRCLELPIVCLHRPIGPYLYCCSPPSPPSLPCVLTLISLLLLFIQPHSSQSVYSLLPNRPRLLHHLPLRSCHPGILWVARPISAGHRRHHVSQNHVRNETWREVSDQWLWDGVSGVASPGGWAIIGVHRGTLRVEGIKGAGKLRPLLHNVLLLWRWGR